jgi:hypothetical protein
MKSQTRSEAEFQQASNLLHHLLNQSLSGLDFCILWQDLNSQFESLAEIDLEVKAFLADADLGALDRALALLPEPADQKPQALPERRNVVQGSWSLKNTRTRDVSRANLSCRQCGFEITLSQEHPPNTEMRLPYDDLTCPFCP